ncbi:hypothetical protein TrLO_g15812 [Triparma laevis f. longispina]|uniref:EGF-like domain-containing protein n=1 Tax=Triparma laevis f. longispina TaxID=1714387 RepID=A0A9W6ZST3_9STRA|nr:hypothetical protein TrLO_g15812 [Triparma laevis f. longispina]
MVFNLDFTSLTCSYTSWSLPSPHCSFHGTCLNGTCLCDRGWTGYSDFINLKDQDCHNSIFSMHVLWICAAGLAGSAILQICFAMRSSYLGLKRKMIKKKDTKNKQLIAKFRRQFIYKPSTCILLCLLICEFGTIQLAYRRIPNEEKVLTPGRLLFVVWPCGFWGVTLLGRLILNLSLTGVNVRGTAVQNRIKDVYKKMMLKGYFDHSALILAGIMGLVSGEENRFGLYSITYYCINTYLAVSLLTFNYQWSKITETIAMAFEGVSKDNNPTVWEVKNKIDKLVKITRFGVMIPMGLTVLLFVVYPPMYKWWGLWLVSLLICVGMIGILAGFIFMVKKKETMASVTSSRSSARTSVRRSTINSSGENTTSGSSTRNQNSRPNTRVSGVIRANESPRTFEKKVSDVIRATESPRTFKKCGGESGDSLNSETSSVVSAVSSISSAGSKLSSIISRSFSSGDIDENMLRKTTGATLSGVPEVDSTFERDSSHHNSVKGLNLEDENNDDEENGAKVSNEIKDEIDVSNQLN